MRRRDFITTPNFFKEKDPSKANTLEAFACMEFSVSTLLQGSTTIHTKPIIYRGIHGWVQLIKDIGRRYLDYYEAFQRKKTPIDYSTLFADETDVVGKTQPAPTTTAEQQAQTITTMDAHGRFAVVLTAIEDTLSAPSEVSMGDRRAFERPNYEVWAKNNEVNPFEGHFEFMDPNFRKDLNNRPDKQEEVSFTRSWLTVAEKLFGRDMETNYVSVYGKLRKLHQKYNMFPGTKKGQHAIFEFMSFPDQEVP